jgi:hypothetical protein
MLRKLCKLGLAVTGLCALLFFLGENEEQGQIGIHFEAEQLRGASHFSIFSVSNSWSRQIYLAPYTTLYWTNSPGIESKKFVQHLEERLSMLPHSVTSIHVPTLEDSPTWKLSFSYEVREPAITGLFKKVTSSLTGKLYPNTFHGAFSETVTNDIACSLLKNE